MLSSTERNDIKKNYDKAHFMLYGYKPTIYPHISKMKMATDHLKFVRLSKMSRFEK